MSLSSVLLPLVLLGAAVAQTSTAAPPQMAAPATNLNMVLSQVEQVAQTTNLDLARLRIEKWKTDSGVKQQMQANSESIQRNLSSALPGMVSQARANPESYAASFKLYRTLATLYDVFLPLSQASEMFAPKSEAQSLSGDLANLDQVRRALGDHLERMGMMHDAELARLRSQVRTQVVAGPKIPKRVVVDDDEPPRKPARKKKPAAKPPAATPPAGQESVPK
jgi:hypothetical protein